MKAMINLIYLIWIYSSASCTSSDIKKVEQLVEMSIPNNLISTTEKVLLIPEGTYCHKCVVYTKEVREEVNDGLLILYAIDTNFKGQESEYNYIDISQYSKLYKNYYEPVLFEFKNGNVKFVKNVDVEEIYNLVSKYKNN